MNTLTGTGALTKLAARRDRAMIVVWLYAITALVAGTVYAFKKAYPTPSVRELFIITAAHNPALLSLYGQLYGHSLGTLTAWRDSSFGALGAAIMSVFIVVRHTRGDEESGRLELVGSAPVGRHAALASALLMAGAANIALGVLASVAAIALGLPAAGSIALAGGIAGSGLAFTAVAGVTAQLAQTARSARGLAFGVLGAVYLLRAVGDSAGPGGPRWLSWLSPIGWAELNQAFGQTIRWWVLALPVITAIVIGIVAALLAAGRDYAAGFLPQRPGPARGSGALRTPVALAWKLQGGTMISWVAGALIYGVVVGSAAKGIGGLLGSSSVRQMMGRLGGHHGLSNAFLAAILSFSGLIAAGFAVSAVLRLRSEETEDRADPVLATGVNRIAWGLSHLIMCVVGTIAILVTVGLGMGLGYTYRAGGGGAEIGRLVGAGLAQVPAALVIGGIAAALFGLAPRASVTGSWSVLGVAVLMLFLGATLQLSHWVLDVSPFTHVPKLPGGTVSAAPMLWLCLIALGLGVAGLIGLRSRDIG